MRLFLYRLARDQKRLDVQAMADEMSGADLLGWCAFYLLEAREQDPEIDPVWDDPPTIQRKLERATARK